MKYRNEKGCVIELDIDLYSQDDKVKTPDYTVNNGMITQNIRLDLIIGMRRISFPLLYMHTNQGVFLSDVPNEVRGNVYISDVDLTEFALNVLPHYLDQNTYPLITSTGY